MHPLRHFWTFFISSWIIYFFLLPLVNIFKIYEHFPIISVLGYGLIILLNLIAINECQKRYDYILVSLNLIAIGMIASTDMIFNKSSMISIWVNQWPSLTAELAADYIQVLIILLNIFTGSIAAQCLFHGLNKRAFKQNHYD